MPVEAALKQMNNLFFKTSFAGIQSFLTNC